MRKLTLLTVLLLTIQSLNCQEIDSSNTRSNKEMYDFHYEKHKKQKKTGFILLGSGVVVYFVGGLIGVNNDLDFAAVAMTAGALTTISSIPVFIVSGSNKRKARTYVQVKQHQPIDLTLSNSKFVSVGIKIDF